MRESVDSCSHWALPAPGFPLHGLMRNPYATGEKCSVSFTRSHFSPISYSWLSRTNHNVKHLCPTASRAPKVWWRATLSSLKFLLLGWLLLDLLTKWLSFNDINRREWWKWKSYGKQLFEGRLFICSTKTYWAQAFIQLTFITEGLPGMIPLTAGYADARLCDGRRGK